jgi:hypothetical protein
MCSYALLASVHVHIDASLRVVSSDMSLVSPSTESVHAFVFGLDDNSKPHDGTTPSEVADEDVDLEGDGKRQSMYVELLDGA